MAAPRNAAQRDGHSSWTDVAIGLVQPTRTAGPEIALEGFPSRRSYSVLLPVGFTVPLLLPGARWALTPPFHPYPARISARPPVNRQTELKYRRGGLLSVALSLGSPPPGVTRHRISAEPGLSSRAAFRRLRVRPSNRLAPRIKAFASQNAMPFLCHAPPMRRFTFWQ
jgi:hypothetical protein